MSIRRGILGVVAASLALSAYVPIDGFAASVKHAAKPVAKHTPVKSSTKSTVPASAAKPSAEKSELATPLPNTSETSAVNTDKTAPVATAHVDFLRAIPLEVNGYDAGKNMPEHFSTADQVMQVIENTPVLLVHMEVLRRGYHDLSPSEQEKLLADLFKRRKTNENDLILGFDHGYAQLVYKENKTGLFFLRKANDKIQSQFSNLAYGMAQVEADINLEGAKPDETTTRKMDATYELADAVKIDAQKHQPGFWPSYVRVIEKMKALPAYQSFTRRDFSEAYVPSGGAHVVPMNGVTTSTMSLTEKTPTSLFSNALSSTSSCSPDAASNTDASGQSAGNVVAQRQASFNGTNALLQFFPTDQAHLYRVRVMDGSGNPVLSFKTYTMPNIVEDIDGDGVSEIVARQYAYNPEQPVLVYRYTPCGFELDKKIFDDFH